MVVYLNNLVQKVKCSKCW